MFINLPNSDLIGWKTIEITEEMVGQKIAQFLSVEVKTPKGRVGTHQQKWMDVVNKHGGLALIARSQEEATEKLNDKQRSAFYLRDVEGCRINEVAEMMDMPEATVRWYLHRARFIVKKELTRTCPRLLLLFGLK